MQFSLARIITRSLRHYWRVNLSVLLAVAVGAAVLTGSLLVGASVRQSLRGLTLERLGPITHALRTETYFREALAADIAPAAQMATPAILLDASVMHADTEARAFQVSASGVSEDFWSAMAPGGKAGWERSEASSGDTILNEALAREIGAKVDDEVILRVPRPSSIGRESFLGKRDDSVETFRLRVAQIIPASEGVGRFGLSDSQRQPLNIFLPLKALQRRIDREGRVNTLLVAGQGEALNEALAEGFQLDDLGAAFRRKEPPPIQKDDWSPRYFSLESSRVFLTDYLAKSALDWATYESFRADPTLVYLANEIRAGERSVPYSIVAGVDHVGHGVAGPKGDELFLNQFAASDLGVGVGDAVSLVYFATGPGGLLTETTTTLRLSRIVPMEPPWTDPGLAPEFPGLSDAKSLGSWESPFPLTREIRRVDETYWDEYRATPKAFVSLKKAESLWGNRFGDLTSIRLWIPEEYGIVNEPEASFAHSLREQLDPAEAGLVFQPVREQGLAASKGASDFGGLFIGFSLFLLASSAALIQILFRLGVEGRSRQFGLLLALGFSPRRARRIFLAEGGLVAAAGCLLGMFLAVGYGKVMTHGLNTWWVGSIGSPFVRLSLSPGALAGGFVGGWGVAMLSIYGAARRLSRVSARRLLAGHLEETVSSANQGRRAKALGAVCVVLGGILLIASGAMEEARVQAMLFFAVGALFLTGCLAFFAAWLRSDPGGEARLTVGRLGRNASRRQPGRNLLVVGLVASATFLIVAVGAGRRVADPTLDKSSGSGGFALLADAAAPIFRAPKTEIREGGEASALVTSVTLNSLLTSATVYPFRVRAGDDASCRNLYQAREPRIFGLSDAFIERGGFTFTGVLDADGAAEENPWELLRRPLADGATPVIGDFTTVRWLLHLGLGKDLEVSGHRLRIVGMLDKSVFQSELLMSDEAFLRLFPDEEGWRSFAVDAPIKGIEATAATLEAALEDFGLDATSAAERLNALMTIENTYLATFQSLGGLGLLLGTLGLALALLRNLIERRREFALLRALGFRFRALLWLALSENILLLLVGMASGAACALLAIGPTLTTRSVTAVLPGIGLTLLGIFLFGLISSALSATAVLRSPVARALREE